MSSIVVSVSELFEQVQLMISDEMDLVEVSIHDPESDESGFVSFEAWKKATAYEGVNYDSIDAVNP